MRPRRPYTVGAARSYPLDGELKPSGTATFTIRSRGRYFRVMQFAED
jgi:hypothetical protein